MHRWLKHVLALSFVSSIAACSAPSGCSALDGMTPLPRGFDENSRIENAASLRITNAGFSFLEQNFGVLAATLLSQDGALGDGRLLFSIPTTAVSDSGYSLTICPDGPNGTDSCMAEIDVAGATLSLRSEAPHDLVFEGSIPVRLTSLPTVGDVAALPIDVDIAVSGGGNDDCDPSSMSFAVVDVAARLSLEVERNPDHELRLGYSMLRIEQLEIDEDQLVAALHACGQGLDDAAINSLKGALAPLLLEGFQDAMVSAANQQLCIKAGEDALAPCPEGTSEQDGLCVYEDGACATTAVGLEGRGDLGVLLRSFSPGTTGELSFLLAGGGSSPRPDNSTLAFGDLNPVNQGATLGLIGGALPDPIANCVNPVDLEIPTGIPMPDEMFSNTLEGWTGPGPHVGLALSERYVNYALAAAYNSGLFCIGLSTEQVAQLSSGLFGLIVPSLKYFTHQKRNAPIAVILRPQAPPTVTLGGGSDLETDPFVRLKLDRAMFDFYVWSSDRFIRVFTAQTDLDVPIDLDISAEGITPVLDKIYVRNTSITNAGLLREQPQQIGAALADVVEGLAGQFLGELQPFDVSGILAPLGLSLHVPAAGVKRLQKDEDSFLGLFAGLEPAPAQPASLVTDTSAELVQVDAPQDAFRAAGAARPSVTLRAFSSAARSGNPVEYSYRLGRGPWRPWSKNADIVVRDPFLRMQGQHTIDVKSRVVGIPSSEDRSPARVHVTLDVDAPRVWITPREDGRVRLEARDLVSAPERLTFRLREGQGPWSAWTRLRPRTSFAVESPSAQVTVEVKDEQGNVASVQQGLIRGRPDPTSGGEGGVLPGCSVPASAPSRTTPIFAFLSVLAGVALLARRRRGRGDASAARREWLPPSPGPFPREFHGAKQRFTPGEGEGRTALRLISSIEAGPSPIPSMPGRTPVVPSHALRSTAAALAVLFLSGAWTGCNCLDDVDDSDVDDGKKKPTNEEQCGTWGAPDCIQLLPGVIGSYTSAAVASDGTLWVAGYNEADWNNDVSYGDLVVGKFDASLQQILWSPVDGVPSSPEPDETVFDTSSWRGGQDNSGMDVGLWTSLALDPSGNPRVAYFDSTNAALKVAIFDGSGWAAHTVYERDDAEAGRYAKLLVVDGKLVVAFQVIESSSGGFATSKVVLGTASSASPASASDWSFEDVAVDDETPCRAHLCPSGQACVAATLQCTVEEKTCDPKCASGEACIDGVCEPEFDGTKLDTYPDAIGGYISMAAVPGADVGIVYYDRIRGNLVQARKDGGVWALRVLDGEAGSPAADTGDMGVGASLFIDDKGDWHVAYVDGFKESLRYMRIQTGTVPHAPVVVDDGSGVGGESFEDGNHVVGDDADVVVSSNGEVSIAYQDATVGKLRLAVGTADGAGSYTWQLRQVDQAGFAGFFPKQVRMGTDVRVVNWWRTGGQNLEGNVRLIAP